MAKELKKKAIANLQKMFNSPNTTSQKNENTTRSKEVEAIETSTAGISKQDISWPTLRSRTSTFMIPSPTNATAAQQPESEHTSENIPTAEQESITVSYPSYPHTTSGANPPIISISSNGMPTTTPSPLTQFKTYGLELKEALNNLPKTSEAEQISHISETLLIYKAQLKSFLDEWRCFMAAEFVEAVALDSEGTSKKVDGAEKTGYGEMILVVEEAKRWVLDVSRPWVPPADLWKGLLGVEGEVRRGYAEVLGRIGEREKQCC